VFVLFHHQQRIQSCFLLFCAKQSSKPASNKIKEIPFNSLAASYDRLCFFFVKTDQYFSLASSLINFLAAVCKERCCYLDTK
jgi:hypothetical protein